VAVVAACAPARRPSPLPPAGSPGDDGTGQLARASVRIWLGDDDPPRPTRPGDGDDDGLPPLDLDDPPVAVGGDAGDAAPAAGDAGRPEYHAITVTNGGAIEGLVRWARPPSAPSTLPLVCGAVANPTVRSGPHGEVEGAIVFLAGIARGRALEAVGGRALTVGGLVEKRGCALWPPAQVLAPAPGTVLLSNADAGPLTLVVGAARVDLATGDRRTVGGPVGITEIADAEGALAPAWIVGLGHPYFALTDAEGRFRIDDVPPGTYQVAVWHPPLVRAVEHGRVRRGEPIEVRRSARVAGGAVTRLTIELPAP